jgi:hypothetical protein
MVSFNRQEPNLVCDHKAREEMFYTVLHASHACFALWKKMSRGNKDWIQPAEASIDEMHIAPTQFQWVRNLSLIFLNQRSRCNKCCLNAAGPDDLDINEPFTSPIPFLPQTRNPIRQLHRLLMKGLTLVTLMTTAEHLYGVAILHRSWMCGLSIPLASRFSPTLLLHGKTEDRGYLLILPRFLRKRNPQILFHASSQLRMISIPKKAQRSPMLPCQILKYQKIRVIQLVLIFWNPFPRVQKGCWMRPGNFQRQRKVMMFLFEERQGQAIFCSWT